jgi:membrane-associated phospholipid phosphatase
MTSESGPNAFLLSKTWNAKPLLLWTAAAVLLFVTWVTPSTRAVWDIFDMAVFNGMNATVAWGGATAAMWAITGDRLFDVFSAVLILVIYLFYISRGDLERFRHGLAFGLTIAVVLFLLAFLQRQIISLPRLSPSLALDSYHSIAAYVPWSRAKEGSDGSFPGDHASVSLIIAALWWLGCSRKLGILGAVLGILFALPRVAAGAHWATDIVIGGGSVTLLTIGLVKGTPLAWRIYEYALKPTDKLLALVPRFENRYPRAANAVYRLSTMIRS